MPVVRYLATRIAVMNKGKIVELGETEQVLNAPQHPYTRSLIEATPELRIAPA
jgi:peptide/nickel transport system ATP-binding protein